jgi:hypothetical protein
MDSGDILSFTGTARYTETHAVIRLNVPLQAVLDFNSTLVDQKYTHICVTLRVGKSTVNKLKLFDDSLRT